MMLFQPKKKKRYSKGNELVWAMCTANYLCKKYKSLRVRVYASHQAFRIMPMQLGLLAALGVMLRRGSIDTGSRCSPSFKN